MGEKSREKKERWLGNSSQEVAGYNRRSTLEKIYFTVIEWGTYLILFTPLILVKSYFFPFVVPKTIFFRILVDIIFLAYILLAVSNPRFRPKFNALSIAIIVFLGIVILTSVTGVNFERSFWSTFERMTGIITFLHLFAFFLVLTSVFKERKYWERILGISIFVGLLVSLYVFTTDDKTARGGGTLGNSTFMAAYLLFDIFFALSLFLAKKDNWRIFYGLSLVPLVWLLLFSPYEVCRGAIGAFGAGIFILIFGFFFYYAFSSGKKILKIIAPLSLVILIIAGVAALQLGPVKTEVSKIIKSQGWEARDVIWRMAIDGWKEKPFLGWGQENFNVPFAKYFNPSLPVSGDIWYDRVHNLIFDMLITSGILGFLSYLSIYIVSIILLIKLLPKLTEKKSALLPLGIVALLAVYFLQDIWVFDMISSYMMFFLTLAFIYFLIEGGKEKQEEVETKQGKFSPIIGGFLIVITVLTFYFGNIQSLRASSLIVKGIAFPPGEGYSFFQKAIDASPMAIFEAPEQFNQRLLSWSGEEDKNVLEKVFKSAEKMISTTVEKNPEDFRIRLFLGRFYNVYYEATSDKEKINLAEKALEEAIALSPKNQQGYWSLAQTKAFEGDTDKMLELIKKALDLEPRFGTSHWYMTMAYKILGQNESAAEEAKKAQEFGYNWKSNLEDLNKVIDIYQKLQDDKSLVELYPLAIEKNPKNAQFWAGLAVAYANLKEYDKARQYGQKALDLKPDFSSQLEKFLNSLPK